MNRIGSALALVVAAGLMLTSPAHADEVRDASWHLDTLRIAEAHQIATGNGIRIGVIDSGVDVRHPDLRGVVVDGRSFGERAHYGVQAKGWDDYRVDHDGHGTAITSILAGRGHGPGNADGVLGVAPDAEVVFAKVPSNDPGGYVKGRDPARAVVDAIAWLTAQDVDIITISLGVDEAPGGQQVVDAARKAGILIVSSAGNSVKEGSLSPHQSMFAIQHPAAYAGVIAVTGTERDGRLSILSLPAKNSLNMPDNLSVAAPMVDIQAARPGGGYEPGTGTSEAAPMVAGLAALIMERFPEVPRDSAGTTRMANHLLFHGTEKRKITWDEKFGYGRIDPVRALTARLWVEPAEKAANKRPAPRGPLKAKESADAASSQPAAPAAGDGGGGIGTPAIVGAVALGLLFAGGAVVVARRVRQTR